MTYPGKSYLPGICFVGVLRRGNKPPVTLVEEKTFSK